MATILLVDDTESLRKLAHIVLTRAGLNVVPAAVVIVVVVRHRANDAILV